MPIGNWFRSRKKTGDITRGLPPDDAEHIGKLLARLDDEPGDLRARRQLADAFRNVRRNEDAVAHYQALVGAFAAQGLLFKAISACKIILELMPEHEETTRTLADLYARRTAGKESTELSSDMSLALSDGSDASATSDDDVPELDAADIQSVPPQPPIAIAPPEVPAEDIEAEDILDVTSLAASMTPLPRGAVRLERPPAVPLFSGLSPDSFASLIKRIDAWAAEPGAVIITEGEESDTVFVVVRGKVRVERGGVVVATMGPDSFFGEMALLTRRPRTATVVAEGKVELLEMSRAVLDDLARKDPSVTAALESFCRARILEGVARSSPMLHGLPDDVVRAVQVAFDGRRARAGDVLVHQGSAGPGLFLVLQGELDVTVAGTGLALDETSVKRLGPGDVFGEMSLVFGRPAAATVTAVTDVSLLLLPRAGFDAFARTHPALEERLAQMATERAAANESLASDDDLELLEDATMSAVLV